MIPKQPKMIKSLLSFKIIAEKDNINTPIKSRNQYGNVYPANYLTMFSYLATQTKNKDILNMILNISSSVLM